MMEAEADVEDSKRGEAKQGVHIVEEVASALEEEGFLKVEATTSTGSSAAIATTVTEGNVSKAAPILTTAARIQPNSSSPGPSKQEIRQESSQQIARSTLSSTWQSGQSLAPEDKSEIENQTESGGSGVWGWVSNAVSASLQTTQSLGRNLVEKTKNSVDTVITTLDPGMEDYMHGREQAVKLTLTTEDPVTVDAIKDGFKQVFEHAIIQEHSSSSSIAPLPVGYSAGFKGAQHRIMNLRKTKKVGEEEVVVAVEEIMAELLPGKWFGVVCLSLQDPSRNLELQTFSQAVEIPKAFVSKAEEMTPSNYNLRWSGYSFSLSEVIVGVGHSQADWRARISGSSKRQILILAGRTLAGQYREHLRASAESLMDKAVLM